MPLQVLDRTHAIARQQRRRRKVQRGSTVDQVDDTTRRREPKTRRHRQRSRPACAGSRRRHRGSGSRASRTASPAPGHRPGGCPARQPAAAREGTPACSRRAVHAAPPRHAQCRPFRRRAAANACPEGASTGRGGSASAVWAHGAALCAAPAVASNRLAPARRSAEKVETVRGDPMASYTRFPSRHASGRCTVPPRPAPARPPPPGTVASAAGRDIPENRSCQPRGPCAASRCEVAAQL